MALEDLIKARLKKLEALKEKGINPYPYKYEPTKKAKEIHEEFKEIKEEEKTGKIEKVAGRIYSIRDLGKIAFIDLRDETGKIQVVVNNSCYNQDLVKYLDSGDFLGAEGEIFRTKRGEISILAKQLEILAKAIRPLPEKFHGLKDIETRYRKRYLDLIINEETREIFRKRTKIIDEINSFMKKNGFLEVEIPLLQPSYGGANAEPFITHSNALDKDLYLSISPELYLKRLIIGGYEKVYTITKNFRNEDIDRTHNPEFTMMECYQAYADYKDVMKFTEKLLRKVVKETTGSLKVQYQEKTIDFEKPFEVITMIDALKEKGFDIENMSNEEIKKEIEKKEEFKKPFERGWLITELFEAYCEEDLIQPTFVIDHMKESTPLCKIHRSKPEQIERFELYINGWEIANAYSEQNNPFKQKELFEEQEKLAKEKHPKDKDFLEALEYGMPPTGGLGLGIDRLVMLLTNQLTIKDVIFFPQMK